MTNGATSAAPHVHRTRWPGRRTDCFCADSMGSVGASPPPGGPPGRRARPLRGRAARPPARGGGRDSVGRGDAGSARSPLRADHVRRRRDVTGASCSTPASRTQGLNVDPEARVIPSDSVAVAARRGGGSRLAGRPDRRTVARPRRRLPRAWNSAGRAGRAAVVRHPQGRPATRRRAARPRPGGAGRRRRCGGGAALGPRGARLPLGPARRPAARARGGALPRNRGPSGRRRVALGRRPGAAAGLGHTDARPSGPLPGTLRGRVRRWPAHSRRSRGSPRSSSGRMRASGVAALHARCAPTRRPRPQRVGAITPMGELHYVTCAATAPTRRTARRSSA